jgi:tetratricopeptide (TPR) repeat protein
LAGRAHTAPVRHRGRASLDHLLQRARTDLIGNPRQALSAANTAVARADAGDDPHHRAAARQVRGDALRFLGQHEAALTDYSSAGELFRRLGQPADAARSEASAADSLRCLGRGAEALRLAQRTRRLLQRLGGEQLRSAVLDEIVGLVYLQQNDYARCGSSIERGRPSPRSAARLTLPRSTTTPPPR